MSLFTNIELVIFDLDGTLYEDTSHFDYYARQLEQELPEEKRKFFRDDYEAMVKGEHIVSIGKAYDVRKDRLLQVEPITNQVLNVWDWNGAPQDQFFYPHPIQFDFEEMIAIGDGWWLPFVCAKHYGVDDPYHAYTKTKDYMATDEFQFQPNPGLREAIEQLKVLKEVVLVTNSDKDDVERLLMNIGLDGLFTDIVASAQKPTRTIEIFEELLKKYKVQPEQAISIGDNYMNEIAPANMLGMKTILIDGTEQQIPGYTGVKIKSMAEIFAEMKMGS